MDYSARTGAQFAMQAYAAGYQETLTEIAPIVCRYCGKIRRDHVDTKCLFDATEYASMNTEEQHTWVYLEMARRFGKAE